MVNEAAARHGAPLELGRMCRRAWSLALVVLCGGGSACAPKHVSLPVAARTESPQDRHAAHDKPSRPAVLLVAPQQNDSVDLGFISELRERGIATDWTTNLSELTAERAQAYNALVLFTSPAGYEVATGATQPPGAEQRFNQVVQEYLASGGGVLMMPEEKNIGLQRLRALTDAWGAQVTAERIVETDPQRSGDMERGSYRIGLAYTDAITTHPATRDVRGIWYPILPVFLGALTLPIVVDRNWTVLVRGSPTSHTEPIDLQKTVGAASGLMQRRGSEAAPALFAVRDAGAGRLALLAQWPQVSFTSGTKWLYDRVVLAKGLRGRSSDLGKLLESTLRWLSEPSLKSGRVGSRAGVGTQTPVNATDEVRRMYRAPDVSYSLASLGTAALPADQRVYRGLIGARTAASGGTGSVREYARAARRGGLDFVVFLEEFSRLTPERLAAVQTECAEASTPDLLLLAGFAARTNIGNPLFVFGPHVAWPPDALLTGEDKRTIYLQMQLPDGTFTGVNRTPFYEWSLMGSPVGFFNFKSAPDGMRLEDVRFSSSAGVRYYEHGRLVEDLRDAYLISNAGTIAPTPLAIHAIDSPGELWAQARAARGLTSVVASSLLLDATDGVFNRGLRFNNQFEAMQTFVSTGPEILRWPQVFRAWTYGAEGFSPERSLLLAPLALHSSVGLRSYEIYDGPRLFRRVALRGAKDHRETLVLDGGTQRDLVLVAKDVKGNEALSFPLRHWSDGSDAPMFCGDHTNDCISQPLLARGPFSLPLSYPPMLSTSESGVTWDGGPVGAFSSLGTQYTLPIAWSGKRILFAAHMTATPMLESSDEGATTVAEVRTRNFDERLVSPGNPWTTYGPLSREPAAFAHEQRYTQWLAHSEGAPPTGHPAVGVRSGARTSLFRSTIRFNRKVDVEKLRFAGLHPPPGAKMAIWSSGQLRVVVNLDDKSIHDLPLGVGDALLFFGQKDMNAHLFINRGVPLQLRTEGSVGFDSVDAPRQLPAGSTSTMEMSGFAFPFQSTLDDVRDAEPVLRSLSDPAAISVQRGSRLASPGLIDLEPHDGVVEVSAPAGSFRVVAPARILGLNPRWSAGLLLKQGPIAGFYGPAGDRFRALALSPDGVAYFPVDVSTGPTHILAGHPIVPGPEGQGLFIQVTCLGGHPFRWHVSINNPTARTVRTELRQTMALPGLAFGVQQVTVGPGELVNLL
jgi:hypothetical protein